MRFDNAFVVRAPIEDVWAALLDVERVAPCMPGAEVLERVDDDTFKVGIRVKVGPIAMTYRGEVQIGERDEAARTATMRAKAKEARGQGTADARIRMFLAAEPDGTHARLETDVQLSGRVAAMGQGVIGDVSAKLVETFAGNLAAMLAPAPAAAEPADAPAANGGAQRGATAVSDEAADAPASAATPARAGAGAPQSTLPVGRIAASVIAGRLKEPRTLVTVALGYAIVCLAIGFVIGRVV